MMLIIFFCSLAGLVVGSAVTALAFRQQAAKKKDQIMTRTIATNDASSSSNQDASVANQQESRDLLGCIIKQLWPYLNPAICNAIRSSVEPALRDLPGPLTTLHFTALDLDIDHFYLGQSTVHDLDDGSVQFDMDIHWTTNRQISLKANYVGSMGVQGIEIAGRLAVVLKPLSKVLPCISAVQFYFLDPPKLQLNFTGLAEIADLQVIKSRVLAAITTTLNNIMVAPHSFVAAKLDPDCDYFSIYRPPVGVVRVTLLQGGTFTDKSHIVGDDKKPDVHCRISLSASQSYQSRTIKNNNNPVWDRDEFFDFLLYDYGQSLFLQVWDEDQGLLTTDDYLGKAEIVVRDILVATQYRTAELPLLDENGNPTGATITISCDVLPLVKGLQSFTEQAPSKKTMGGLITILLERAFAVPLEALEMLNVTSIVRVHYGDATFETLFVPGSNPHYNMAFHIPISTETYSKGGGEDITFRLLKCVQENLLASPQETLLGEFTISHSKLQDAVDCTINETQPIGGDGAALRYRISMQGIGLKTTDSTLVDLPSASESTDVPAPPEEAPIADPVKDFSTVKITAVQGRHFKIQRPLLRKAHVADVYLKIQVGSDPKNTWKTKTIVNDAEPVWGEAAAFVLSGKNERIKIKAYDAAADKGLTGLTHKDEKLGSAELTVDQLLVAGGTMEVELELKGKPTGSFVTIRCEKVAT